MALVVDDGAKIKTGSALKAAWINVTRRLKVVV